MELDELVVGLQVTRVCDLLPVKENGRARGERGPVPQQNRARFDRRVGRRLGFAAKVVVIPDAGLFAVALSEIRRTGEKRLMRAAEEEPAARVLAVDPDKLDASRRALVKTQDEDTAGAMRLFSWVFRRTVSGEGYKFLDLYHDYRVLIMDIPVGERRTVVKSLLSVVKDDIEKLNGA